MPRGSGTLVAALWMSLMPLVARAEGRVTVEEVVVLGKANHCRTFTLTGKIVDAYTDRVFLLAQDEQIDGDELLVLAPDPIVATYLLGDLVRVRGKVRWLSVAEVERRYGVDLDLAPEETPRSVLVATWVDLTPEE